MERNRHAFGKREEELADWRSVEAVTFQPTETQAQPIDPKGENGGSCRIRTYDHRIKSAVLYQLS